MEQNILEPCCYIKQLHHLLEHARDGVATAFHFGDVLASHLLERTGVRCKSDGVLYVVLPSIDAVTVDEIRRLLLLKCYNPKSMRTEYEFTTAIVLTRSLTGELRDLAADAGCEAGSPRVHVAVDSGLGFRMLGFRSPDRCMMVTGSIVQRVQCGAHFLVFGTTHDVCGPVFDFVDSESRVHRVPMDMKSNAHAKGI